MKLDANKIKQLKSKIEQYKSIVVFRHEAPDFDALGSQYGLVEWLKHNFKNKEIIFAGKTNVEVGFNLFKVQKNKKITKPFLAIILDTANKGRISGDQYKDADFIIKIDHHPSSDDYGDLNIIHTEASSVGELLYYILNHQIFNKMKFTNITAHYLMVGLIGDTGRLVYPSTTIDTVTAYLEMVKSKINLQSIFKGMYTKSVKEIKIIKKVYDKLKITKKGLGYFYFLDKDLKSLKMHPDEVVKYLPLLANYNEIKIFASITEDKSRGMFRASIRSNDVIINQVAQKFNGGGHKHAAGAKLKTIKETKALLKALNALI